MTRADASQPPVRKPPRPVTREWLFRAAGYYLERYGSSSGNLRRAIDLIEQPVDEDLLARAARLSLAS